MSVPAIKPFPLTNLVIGCYSDSSFKQLSRAISAFVISTPPSGGSGGGSCIEHDDDHDDNSLFHPETVSNRELSARVNNILSPEKEVFSQTQAGSQPNEHIDQTHLEQKATQRHQQLIRSRQQQNNNACGTDNTASNAEFQTSKLMFMMGDTVSSKNGWNIVFTQGDSVPRQFIQSLQLVEEPSLENDGCKEYTVLSTEPFMSGN